MSVRTVAVMTVLVVLAGVVAAVPAGALVYGASPAQSGGGGNGTNVSLGATVSAFMQASAAEARGTVDNRMFSAAFNRTADDQARARLVDGRTKALEMRLDRLQTQRDALLNGSDELTVAERAKAARLAARIESLQRAINQTDSAAERAGVNSTRLDALRQNANELSGPEVAALAGGLVGDSSRGPPGAGPQGKQGEGGNGAGAPVTPGNGPPFGPQGNGTDVGADGNQSNNASDRSHGSNEPSSQPDGSGSDGSTEESDGTETETADGQ